MFGRKKILKLSTEMKNLYTKKREKHIEFLGQFKYLVPDLNSLYACKSLKVMPKKPSSQFKTSPFKKYFMSLNINKTVVKNK